MKFYEDQEYILMCEKANEIQDFWVSMNVIYEKTQDWEDRDPQRARFNEHFMRGYQGSFYYNLRSKEIGCVDYEYETNSLEGNFDIWIPLQHQLQEMIEKEPADCIQEFLDNSFEKDTKWSVKRFMMGTYEKAWLSLVMKKLHNKTWNGKEWVKLIDLVAEGGKL